MTTTHLLVDLAEELPGAVRLQRLVQSIREDFGCDAVGLLRLDENTLRLVAADGLVHEALGRRFSLSTHPRLAAILDNTEAVQFESDSSLPDPYDGLLETRKEEPLLIHDCLGQSLYVNGALWGALTLDASRDTFDADRTTSLKEYVQLIQATIRMNQLEQENRKLRMVSTRSAMPRHVEQSGEILGDSPVMRSLMNELAVIASSDLPILLLGETGVGKDLFAQHIHRLSARSGKPMVHINCAALPDTLAESELFGHVKGAFSGADAARAGSFEAAHGGSLFLDEVGELSLRIQAKLLRTLQNGEIQRLGSDKPRTVDVRIIAATNRDLKKSILDGDFRMDLYHRLSVYPVLIPPLRERGKDILLLAGYFLESNRSRLGLRSIRLTPEAETALMQYAWPGNVRELEHVISRAALKMLSRGAYHNGILSIEPRFLDVTQDNMTTPMTMTEPSGTSLEQRDNSLLHFDKTATDSPQDKAHRPVVKTNLKAAVADFQRQCITQALGQAQNNWTLAANALGMDASNLHKLAKKLGLK